MPLFQPSDSERFKLERAETRIAQLEQECDDLRIQRDELQRDEETCDHEWKVDDYSRLNATCTRCGAHITLSTNDRGLPNG